MASKKIKQAGINTPIIAGGYDISFEPQLLELSDLDIICIGEGKQPIVELADNLAAGRDFHELKIKNLHIKQKNGTVVKQPMRYWQTKLDGNVFNDREIYMDADPFFKTMPHFKVMAGRGCPYACSYCFNVNYSRIHRENGMKVREYTIFRSVDNVIDELKILAEKYPDKDFHFIDSTLTLDKDWIINFCKAYTKAKLKPRFALNAVATELTEEVCQALANTKRCMLVNCGMETGNEKFRIHSLRKNIKNAQIEKAFALLSKYKIKYCVLIMIGLPGETMEQAWETISFAQKIGNKNASYSVSLFQPFPGLDINNIGLELGEYSPQDIKHPGKPVPASWPGATNSQQQISVGNIIMPKTHKNIENLFFKKAYRNDQVGQEILKLSKYAVLVIKYPLIRPVVEKLIKLPDNKFNDLICTFTSYFFHMLQNVPLKFLIKYVFIYRDRKLTSYL